MATALKLRRGTTSQHSTFTGAEGELTVDTTKDTAVVHDGTTAGGFPLVTENTAQTVSGAKTFTGANAFNGTLGATTPAAGTFTSLSDSGNLTFTGTGNRILGDFSNATPANRVALQTSGTNSSTLVGIIPSGTGTVSSIEVLGNSDHTNASYMAMVQVGSTESRIQSTRYGTGTFAPMTFYTSQAERMRIDSSGNVGIGTSSPSFTSGSGLFVQRSGGSSVVEVSRSDASVSGSLALIGGSVQNNIYSVGAKPLVFFTNSTEHMRLGDSGNLQFNSGYGSAATAYGCRAWVNFNGTGTVAIRASGNVSSITDNATGNYTVNFTTAMPDANYSTMTTCNQPSNTAVNLAIGIADTGTNSSPNGAEVYTTSAVKLKIQGADGPDRDMPNVMVAIFR